MIQKLLGIYVTKLLELIEQLISYKSINVIFTNQNPFMNETML